MKLLDRVADVGAKRHLSPLTVECYQRWMYEFLEYCATRSADAGVGGDGGVTAEHCVERSPEREELLGL